MTEKRFTIKNGRTLQDNLNGKAYVFSWKCDAEEVCNLLNESYDENEQLKQLISKIDFAIIRKYDNSLENLLDEIYDGEYNKWINKQVLRAKKLDGDVE